MYEPIQLMLFCALIYDISISLFREESATSYKFNGGNKTRSFPVQNSASDHNQFQ